MRYSVDSTAVTALVTDVASYLDDATTAAAQTVLAVDDATTALRSDAAGVRGALDAVFASRRQSGPSLTAHAAEMIAGIQAATVAYVSGDEEMASTTSTASSAVPPLRGRGFGPAIF
jgi:hypothetical protein